MLGWFLFVATAAWALRRALGGYPVAEGRLQLLHAREVAFLEAASDAMFPAGGAVPVSGSEAGMVEYTDRFLRSLDRAKCLQIRLLFAFFEHATLFFPGPGVGGLRRFSSQSPPAREAILRGWWSSSMGLRRLLFQALRAVLTMAYLGSPAVLRRLGLAPLAIDSPVLEPDLLYPPVGQSPEANPFSSRDLTPPSEGVPLDPRGPLHPGYAQGNVAPGARAGS